MMNETGSFKQSILVTVVFLAVLWGIKALELGLGSDYSFLGIYPRTAHGALGIVTAPWIHGDIPHLVSNTFPLGFLGVGIVYFYKPIALKVFTIIYLATGLCVWSIARPAFHVGASGLVYGLASFLFFMGLFRRDAQSLAISLVVLFLYHGLFAGLFPLSERVSWESHVLGGMVGLGCSFFFRKYATGASEHLSDGFASSQEAQAPASGHLDDAAAAETNITLPEGLATKMSHNESPIKTSEDSNIISLN